MFRVDLRRLIIALCLFSTLLAAATFMLASYLVQREQLVSTAMESHRVYALKLAKLTDSLLTQSRKTLAYVAQASADPSLTPEQRQTLLTNVYNQTSYFNSMALLGKDNTVVAEAPASVGMLGTAVNSERCKAVLQRHQATITEPYVASTGRMVLSHLMPVPAPDGQYQGYVIGTLYLHQDNELRSLLGEHYFMDGSYTYVLDQQGNVVLHTDARWVAKPAPHKEVVEALRDAAYGKMTIQNADGLTLLAGFAKADTSGWGVVVVRPQADVLMRLNELTLRTLLTAAPLVLLSLILIAWLATHIVRPLRTLADLARTMEDPQTTARLRKTPAWYFEAVELKHALLNGLSAINHKIRNLHHESKTDMLSGLLNRRGLRAALDELSANRTPTAIIVLDIDHFKRVNDTLGHDSGDTIIRMMADRMRIAARTGDITARSGGEEFVMLLPDTTAAEAWHIAEQLRRDIHETPTTASMPITVSCGIAQSPEIGRDLDEAWQLADKALYRAKRSGRDCSFVAEKVHESNA